MTRSIKQPERLQINGWSPDCANTGVLLARTTLGLERQIEREQLRAEAFWLRPREAPAPESWRDPEVGWGLLLPDNPALSDAEQARGDDAPAPLRTLLAARPGAPVLRWAPTLGTTMLRRYYEDGSKHDLMSAAPNYGIGRGRVPRYLLIYGSPAVIPWSVQYALNLSLCVGRLDLGVDEGLDHYVAALIDDWPDARCDVHAPLIWSVDHGRDDITWLMARAIANPVAQEFRNDIDLSGWRQLKNAEATTANLLTELTARRPGLIITTSHGVTGPLDNRTALTEQLGLPVDAAHQPVSLEKLKAWCPSGAIWYAHACCAAGSDHRSRYASLFDTASDVGRILNGVSKNAGACIAPLPRALLGSSSPLRAFIAHVEPTFDWTLRHPKSHQVLTGALVSALYNNLYRQNVRTPVGWALREIFKESGALYGAQLDAVRAYDRGIPGAGQNALFQQLAAMDLQSLVVLGDPTVALPHL